MSKDLEQQLTHGLRPRRELRADFTADTLAKALAPQPRWWSLHRVRSAPAIAAVAILLTASSAYAAFNWQQVQVFFTGVTQNKTFDTQEFGFRVDACPGGNGALRFGVAKTASVTPAQIASIIKARCEVAQANALFAAQPDWKNPERPNQQAPIDDTYFAGSIVTIEKIEGNQLVTRLAVQDPHGKPLAQSAQDTLAADLRVYANGQQVPAGSLKPGDHVVQVLRATERHNDGRPSTIVVEVRGLIKVAAEPVETALFNHVFEIKPCEGNPDATCVDAPSPALRGVQFHANEGEGGNFKVRKDITYDSNGAKGGAAYQVQGRVVAMDATGFTVRAFESHTPFRVNIAEADRKAPYGLATTLELGDAVAIKYLQKPTEDRHVIAMPDIQASYIIVTSDNQKL